MAQWQRTLNLDPEWTLAKDKVITIQALSGIVSERLKGLVPFKEEHIENDREELVDKFKELYEQVEPEADADEFDELMDQLCDWADTKLDSHWNGKKVCWVKRS